MRRWRMVAQAGTGRGAARTTPSAEEGGGRRLVRSVRRREQGESASRSGTGSTWRRGRARPLTGRGSRSPSCRKRARQPHELGLSASEGRESETHVLQRWQGPGGPSQRLRVRQQVSVRVPWIERSSRETGRGRAVGGEVDEDALLCLVARVAGGLAPRELDLGGFALSRSPRGRRGPCRGRGGRGAGVGCRVGVGAHGGECEAARCPERAVRVLVQRQQESSGGESGRVAGTDERRASDQEGDSAASHQGGRVRSLQSAIEFCLQLGHARGSCRASVAVAELCDARLGR